tara:strand:- start:437 stop:907 length:471 start_codon:yes stop_codon:yes gene_type:complete
LSDSPQIRLQPRESPEALCGFCRDSFIPEEEVRSCEGCDSPYHLECWRDELEEKCATLGCSNEKPARGPRRFHALRGRLRRRRRRRLLDGGMARGGTTQGQVFVVGCLLALLAGIAWAITNLDASSLAVWVVGGVVSLGAAAAVAQVRSRNQAEGD